MKGGGAREAASPWDIVIREDGWRSYRFDRCSGDGLIISPSDPSYGNEVMLMREQAETFFQRFAMKDEDRVLQPAAERMGEMPVVVNGQGPKKKREKAPEPYASKKALEERIEDIAPGVKRHHLR